MPEEVNIRNLTARELVAGLMRGNRDDLKRGYSAAAAVGAATDYRRLGAEEVVALKAFAEGFSDGMADSLEATDPAVHYKRFRNPLDRGEESVTIVGAPPSVLHSNYNDGLTLGAVEDRTLYPTIPHINPALDFTPPVDGEHRQRAIGGTA